MSVSNQTLDAYTGTRPDVLGLIDGPPHRVLDIGCSDGTLLASLGPGIESTGIEIDPELAALATSRVNLVIEGDACASTAELIASGNQFDLIVLADVLEHLVEPGEVLRNVKRLLEPGGSCLVSLPNVRFWTTFTGLAFRGRWPRRDRGVHDRTHLHWYTDSDARDLFAESGLRVDAHGRNLRLSDDPNRRGNSLAKLVAHGPFRPFLTYQNLYRLRAA